jgi:hypothetical protein
MRRALAVAVAAITVATVILAGCSRPGPAGLPTDWQPPQRYAYTLESRCGEQLLIGRIRLWVDGGAVVGAEGLDEPGRRLAEVSPEHLPTLATLVGYYNDAVATGADQADLVQDPADGHPVRIDIDHSERAVDDESCFVIEDYSPGESRHT